MNLPNKLTIFRVILIPFFVLFLLLEPDNQTFRLIADLILSWPALRICWTGRLRESIIWQTNFGKFMDPWRQTAGVFGDGGLVATGQLAAWIVIIIISREFIISGFRLIALGQRHCDRCQHVGQIQDRVPDADDHCADRKHPAGGLRHDRNRADLCGTGADCVVSGGLYCQK